MKKFLNIVLSAIIVCALVLTPMTVLAEEGVTYTISSATLKEGTDTYAVDAKLPYTVYILTPTTTGDFTITSDDCMMGIVSYLDMWVQFEPTEENVNLSEIDWSCTDIGQAIMIAVKAETTEISITITRTDLDTSDEIPWTIYENIFSPKMFEMPSYVDVDALADGYIDFEDDIIDDAVLGDDGCYHVNDKNGPVLFANLNDSIMSLYTMSSNGRLSATYYDDNGKLTKRVDYTDAFGEYIAALPVDDEDLTTSYYYPLTADLIEMFKEIGASHGWYSGEDAWVYESDDAWMYAFYYDENVTKVPCFFNHTMDEPTKEYEKAATCTEEGSYYSVIYCIDCKEELSRETVTVAALGHTEGEPTKEHEKAATCTEEGSYDSVIYCIGCEEELSRETVTVAALGHTEGEPTKEHEKAATCTEEGSYDIVIYCIDCKEELSRETKVIDVDPDAHVYDNYEDTICNKCEHIRIPFDYGDINGDRFVNNKDLGVLMQYLNEWEVDIVLDVSDVNVDGAVNNKDYGVLMQHLNEWDVTLGPVVAE